MQKPQPRDFISKINANVGDFCGWTLSLVLENIKQLNWSLNEDLKKYKTTVLFPWGMDPDKEGRYWQYRSLVFEHNWDISEDNGQMGTEVEIRLQMSHNALTTAEEHIKW